MANKMKNQGCTKSKTDRDKYDSAVRNSYAKWPAEQKKGGGTEEPKESERTFRGGGREETGKKATGGEIVKNAVYSGLNQFNKGLFSTLDFLLPTEFLGKYDVVSNANDYYSRLADKYSDALEESTSDRGKAVQIGAKTLSNTVAAVPNAALALMTGGSSAAAQGSTSALSAASTAAKSSGVLPMAANAVQNQMKNPVYWSSAAQTLGNNYESAKATGASELEAIGSAYTSSLLNAAVETGGGLETLPNVLKKGSTGPAAAWAKSALTEGLEEPLQSAVSGLTQKLFFDRDKKLTSLSDETAVLNPRRMGREFFMGTAVGGILGAGQLAGSNLSAPDPMDLAKQGDYSGLIDQLNHFKRQKNLNELMTAYKKKAGIAEAKIPANGDLDAPTQKRYDEQKEDGLYGGEEASDILRIHGTDVWSKTPGIDIGRTNSYQENDHRNNTGREAADWARGYIVEQSVNPASVTAESQAKDYYPDVYIIEDAVLKAHRPNAWATTSKGVIYISDSLPEHLANVVGYHEVVHAAKQQTTGGYREFLDTIGERINLRSDTTGKILEIVLSGQFKDKSLFELNANELKTAYDELNAVIWGFYKADPDNARAQFAGMFKDYDGYISELDAIMEKFKISNWGDWDD